MKKCFGCLRRLKFLARLRKERNKWVGYVENYCTHNSKFQWCELIMENYEEIRKFASPSEEALRELRSTNMSSEVIKTIRKDYEHKFTPFTLLVQIFSSYVIHKYKDVVNPTQVTINKIAADLEHFIDFMRSLIVIYYNLEERELIGDDQFFRVTLSNFITDCLFLREDFNSCLMQIVKSSCKQSVDRIAFNIQKFSKLTLQDYQINAKYSLDSSTLRLFNLAEQKQLPAPYAGAIKIVKQIVKARTPVEKTKCAQNLLTQVQFSIKKFYQDHKINEQIVLDADNAIAILLYVLVQSEQSQLLTHLNIVYNFLNKESLEGSLHFCLGTIKACLQFLEKGSIRRNKGLSIEESQFSLWINAQSYFEQTSTR